MNDVCAKQIFPGCLINHDLGQGDGTINRKWVIGGVAAGLILVVIVYMGAMFLPEVKQTPVIKVQADVPDVPLDNPIVTITGSLRNVTDPSAYQLICEQNIDGEVGWVADATPITVAANGSFTYQANVGYSGSFVDLRLKCVISGSTIYSDTLRIAILVNPGE